MLGMNDLHNSSNDEVIIIDGTIKNNTTNTLNNSVIHSGLKQRKNISMKTKNVDTVEDPIDTNIVLNNPIQNNWTEQHETTLRGWKTSLIKNLHIYQFVLDSSRSKMNRVLFAVEILGVLASLLATVSASALGFSKIKANNTIVDSSIFTAVDIIAFVISIIIVAVNLTITLLNRLIKIYKWDTTISDCSAYISKMDQICSTISVELSLTRNSRSEANKFMKDTSVKYLDLIQTNPNVDLEDQDAAMKQYDRFINGKINNFQLTQKYAKDDNNIDII